MRRLASVLACVMALSGCAGVDWDAVAQGVASAAGGAAPATDAEIASGLREALATGTERAVARLGRTDGFWKDAALRIPVPDSLSRAEKLLRKLGQDRVVDDFQLSLNRAAEQAVPEAAAVFGEAIRGLTLADARRVLEGPDDAATALFRERTSAALADRFKPIVARATGAAGATRNYKSLVSKVGRYVDTAPLDLDAYVTERALAGLFTTLAGEEKRIRDDPAARSTELLRRVFGR